MNTPFKPTLYLKEGCPFCMKVRIFLLEAGLLEQVAIREFTQGTLQEQEVRNELGAHLPKLSFPTAQLAPGHYLTDSDAIVQHFATLAKVEPSQLPTFRSFTDGLMASMKKMYLENLELKKPRH